MCFSGPMYFFANVINHFCEIASPLHEVQVGTALNTKRKRRQRPLKPFLGKLMGYTKRQSSKVPQSGLLRYGFFIPPRQGGRNKLMKE